MLTYELLRTPALHEPDPALNSHLARQIQAAIDGGANAGGSLAIVADFVPGEVVAEGTDVVVVRHGASGAISVPAHVGAIVFEGSQPTVATLDLESAVAVRMGAGDDVLTLASPTGGYADLVVSVDLGEGNDVFFGAQDARNHVVGGAGDDSMVGGRRNDLFEVGEGSDTVDAGAGYDQALVRGSIGDYIAAADADGSLVLTHRSSGEVTRLANLEFLTFEDGAVMLAVTTEAGFVAASLFEVILGRGADPVVHEHFANADHQALIMAATGMLESPEFASKFGAVSELSDGALLEILYASAFDQPADPEGLGYWLDRLANGMSRGEVAVHIARAAEGHADFAATIHLIDKDPFG